MISSTAARRISNSKMLTYGDYINEIDNCIKKAALNGRYWATYPIPNPHHISDDMLQQIVDSYQRCGYSVFKRIGALDIEWDKDY